MTYLTSPNICTHRTRKCDDYLAFGLKSVVVISRDSPVLLSEEKRHIAQAREPRNEPCPLLTEPPITDCIDSNPSRFDAGAVSSHAGMVTRGTKYRSRNLRETKRIRPILSKELHPQYSHRNLSRCGNKPEKVA
jgi:hypothetical protein